MCVKMRTVVYGGHSSRTIPLRRPSHRKFLPCMLVFGDCEGRLSGSRAFPAAGSECSVGGGVAWGTRTREGCRPLGPRSSPRDTQANICLYYSASRTAAMQARRASSTWNKKRSHYPDLQSCQISHEILHWHCRARSWFGPCESHRARSHTNCHFPVRKLQGCGAFVPDHACEISHSQD